MTMDSLPKTVSLMLLMICTSDAFTGCQTVNVTPPLNVETSVVNDNNAERLTARFTCDTGFLYGSASLVCEEDDQWSGDPPFCIILTFQALDSNPSRLLPRIFLKDGTGYNHGRVEITSDNGYVFTLCQEGFDENVAKVICSYLGYSAIETIELNSHFGPSNKRIFPVQFVCNGSESHPGECDTTGISSQCDSTTEVAIRCKAGEMRLSSPHGYSDEGLLEVYHFSRWNIMDIRMDNVQEVCRMLGFGYTGFTAYSNGQYNSPTLENTFICDDQDSTILACNSSTGFFVMFGQMRNIFLAYCFDNSVSNMRLTQGILPFSGYLEIEMGGRWKAPCTNRGINSLLQAVCGTTTYVTSQGAPPTETWATLFSCTGNLSCKASPYSECQSQWTPPILVHCNKETQVNGIDVPINGHVNYSTMWGGEIIADVGCELGFVLNGPSILTYRDGSWQDAGTSSCEPVGCETFNVTPPLNVETSVVNDNNAERLTAWFTCDTGFLYGSASLVCEEDDQWSGDQPSCITLTFRSLDLSLGVLPRMLLKDGTGYNHGRVEITTDSGDVFTLCQEGFDENVARVICSYLGFSMMETIQLDSYFGPSNKRIFPAQFVCNGSERHLGECETKDISSQCDNTTEVAIRCKAGEMRLSSPYGYSDEGFVEVYHYKKWNYIQIDDAQEVCRMLGFGYMGFPAYYRLEESDIALTVQYLCDEDDTTILECNSSRGFTYTNVYYMGKSDGLYAVYCLDNSVSNMRLTQGIQPFTGYLEIEMGGRWRSSCANGRFSVHGLMFAVCGSTSEEKGMANFTNEGTPSEAWTAMFTCTDDMGCHATIYNPLCYGTPSHLVHCNKETKVDGINIPENGHVNYTTMLGGEIIADVGCDLGFVLNGPSILTFKDGSWPGASPYCEPVECPPLEPIEFGSWSSYNPINRRVGYYCDAGYSRADLYGSIFRYCQEDGTWSEQPGFCVKPANLLGISTNYPWSLSTTFPVLYKNNFREIRISHSVPIFGKTHYKIFVCKNGIVTFDDPLLNPVPERDPRVYGDRTILAPFYADINFCTMRYRVLDIFEQDDASSMLTPNWLNEDFMPTFILIVQWLVAEPFESTFEGSEGSTFELMMISDGRDTFVGYTYQLNNMGWKTNETSPDVWIGYYSGEQHYETWSHSFTTKVLRPDIYTSLDGNTNRLVYRLTSPHQQIQQDPATECIKWYTSHRDVQKTISDTSESLPDCPCTMSRLLTDPWFNPRPSAVGNVTCFVVLPLRFILPAGKTCCYNTSTSKWIDERPLAGGFDLYHPSIYPREHQVHDVSPKRQCCSTLRTCELYYNLRPIGSCYRETWFTFGSVWGDPHFTTLDGRTFTFNGLGEYTLLNISDNEVSFELQARTTHARRPDHTIINATVFNAFAAHDDTGASIHVELTRGRDGIILYANGADLSLPYSEYSTDRPFMFLSKEQNLVVVRRQDTMRVTFASTGVSLNISHNVGMLAVNVMVPGRYRGLTKGLLGNYDGDITNDFQAPDGTVFASSMSEREVFAYGSLWEVRQPAFYYSEHLGHADFHFANFTPPFLDEADQAKVDEAVGICGDIADIPCVFDYVFTEDVAVAENTKTIEEKAAGVKHTLDEVIPSARTCDTQNVTLGDTVTCVIEADISSNITVNFVDNDVGAVFNATSGVLTFEQTNETPPTLRLVATTEDGVESPDIFIDVLFCSGCSGHGSCTGKPRADRRETTHFRYSTCECNTGYAGEDCELDYNGCASKPCSQDRACVDLSPEDEQHLGKSYSCGSCFSGYQNVSGDKCIDTNECTTGEAQCSHICANEKGGYTCSCFHGYKVDVRDRQECQDIDECTEGSHDCGQVCENVPGTFRCTCYRGYRFDPNKGCITVVDTCEDLDNPPNCSLTAGCRVTSDKQPECFCKNGYRLTSNGTACEDVDECDLRLCSQRCNNYPGGYTCACHDGFELYDNNKCRPCQSPSWGPGCSNNCNCSEQGTDHCHHIKGCQCRSGWKGNNCVDDVDECEHDICIDVTKRCVNLRGTYTCVCRDGFKDNGQGSCEDIDECGDILLHQCDQLCINGYGGYACACYHGYTPLSSTHCEDIDECSRGISGCEHLCENQPGRHNCYCRYGYYLREDRRTCEKYLDPCVAYANLTCSHYCVLENQQAFCRCNLGYHLAQDNQTCQDDDECSSGGSHGCSSGSECMNTPGSYQCVCPTGTQLQNDGRTCKDCDRYHYGPNCSLACDCLNGQCDKQRGCICGDGWTGFQCNLDIDECARNSDLCPDLNHACVNTVGGYNCQCQSGYVLLNGACVDLDECSDTDLNDCDHVCVNTQGGFDCLCHHGYTWNGSQCVDLDECSGLHQCEHTCENTEGGYRCLCKEGFTLNLLDRRTCQAIHSCNDGQLAKCAEKNSQCFIEDFIATCTCAKGYQMVDGRCTDIEECIQSPPPCSHTCEELPGSYQCSCPAGFYLDVLNTSCTVCTGWQYGDGCRQQCPCNRGNTQSCDPADGTCTCHAGWKGDNCIDDVDECSMVPGSPCPSHSACVNSLGSYRCQCEPGFFETVDEQCQACPRYRYGEGCSLTCNCNLENTDTCDHVTGNCLCRNGWTSDTCEADVDECDNETACPFHQRCVNTVGSYTCLCKDEYLTDAGQCHDPCQSCLEGTKCENGTCVKATERKSFVDQVILYGSVGGGCLVLVVVMVTSIVCLRRRSNRRKQRDRGASSNQRRPYNRKNAKQRDFDEAR